MCLCQLSRSRGTGSEKNRIAQLVCRLSLREIMIQGRTNIGQLVSQLWLFQNLYLSFAIVEINTWCYRKPKQYRYSTMQSLKSYITNVVTFPLNVYIQLLFNALYSCPLTLEHRGESIIKRTVKLRLDQTNPSQPTAGTHSTAGS